ncbi:hypothetical protein TNCV_1100411 [Trichonephila clavipes]|nr:hypothetical protein TNCV_1100411 [Trichonephila clavipes]
MDPEKGGGYAHSDIVWIRYKRSLSVRLFGSCQVTYLDGRYFMESGEKISSRLEIEEIYTMVFSQFEILNPKEKESTGILTN